MISDGYRYYPINTLIRNLLSLEKIYSRVDMIELRVESEGRIQNWIDASITIHEKGGVVGMGYNETAQHDKCYKQQVGKQPLQKTPYVPILQSCQKVAVCPYSLAVGTPFQQRCMVSVRIASWVSYRSYIASKIELCLTWYVGKNKKKNKTIKT